MFRDSAGAEWRIEFDAFSLEDINSELQIDLGDLTAGGWHKLATHSPTVAKVMAVLLRDEIKAQGLTDRQFAKRITGDAIDRARAALEAAAANFFPASEWSSIQSNLTKRKETTDFRQQWTTIAPILTAIESMPLEMRQGAMEEIRNQMAAGIRTGSAPLAANGSAGG